MPILTAPRKTSSAFLYIVFMIDSNVVRDHRQTTLLQWFQPNLLVTDHILNANINNKHATKAVGASYLEPSPPYGSGPHEYTLLLFEQPQDFSVPAQYDRINPPADVDARVGFNITEFIAATKLGTPVAANYFRALNGSAAQTKSVSSSIAAVTRAMTSEASPTSDTKSASAITVSFSGKTITPTVTTSATGASQSSTNGAVDVKSSSRELFVGLGMAIVGAGVLMA